MIAVTVEEAAADLAAWIAKLKPGEELLITQLGHTVARLTAEPPRTGKPRQPGSAVGKLTVVEEDDAHLDDFEEYSR